MNDSNGARKLNHELYRKEKHSWKNTKLYTIVENWIVVYTRPVVLAKAATIALLTDPRKVYLYASGKKKLNSTANAIEEDKKEYNEWIEATRLSDDDLVAQRIQGRRFKYTPLVSLITPVFNPPHDALNELIESVIAQTYENFELMLYNFSNNNDNNSVTELLNDWAKKDKRVVVKHGLQNGHISKNSNRALKDVRGEFIGLLDHDDALTQNALFECIAALNENPKLDFIYTDKDKITEAGERFEGFFKPDWSPEMILGGNYLTHFDLMRTSAVNAAGGWDSDTDGAQDWDLFLKILDSSDRQKHVPKIVYHWRIVEGSTAGGMGAKPYALHAQNLAVKKHLTRNGVDAEPYHDQYGQSYVRWPARNDERLIILHDYYGDAKRLHRLHKSLKSQGHKPVAFIEKSTEGMVAGRLTNDEYVTYESGNFIPELQAYAQKSNAEQLIYIKDAIDSIEHVHGSDWVHQLSGWLTIHDVALAGAAVLSPNGGVIDIGSIYDSNTKRFGRLHYGAVHRSGYNGYIQWIRNFTKPSEQLCVFETKLLGGNVIRARDDELITALSLAAAAQSQRAVYDPTVTARDRSRHYIVSDNSDAVESLIQGCSALIDGDPYFNENLSFDLVNPKPVANRNKRGSIEAGTYKPDNKT